MGIAMEKVPTSDSKLGSCNHEEDDARVSCIQSIFIIRGTFENPDKNC